MSSPSVRSRWRARKPPRLVLVICAACVLAGLAFYAAAWHNHRLATQYDSAPVCVTVAADTCKAARPATVLDKQRHAHSRSPDDCSLSLLDGGTLATKHVFCNDPSWRAITIGQGVQVERWNGTDTAILTASGAVRTNENPEIGTKNMLLYGSVAIFFGLAFLLFALFGKGPRSRQPRVRTQVTYRYVVTSESPPFRDH